MKQFKFVSISKSVSKPKPMLSISWLSYKYLYNKLCDNKNSLVKPEINSETAKVG